MQFGLAGSNPQRSHASQILSDQSMNIGLDILSFFFSISSGAWLLLLSFHCLFLPLPRETKIWEKLESILCNATMYSFEFYVNGDLKILFGLLLAVFNMGSSPGGMMPMQPQQQQQQQQQQHGSQGAFGNMPTAQNLQSNMVALQNNPQSHPNFAQQRQQNQQ